MDNSIIILSILSVFITYIIVLMFVSIWHIFKKSGKPGWASIIPIYNSLIWLEISERPTWWIILLFIPIVNLVVSIIVNESLGKKFGKSSAFGALGLSFLPFIFYPILASPKTKYMDKDIQELKQSRISKLGILLSSLIIHCFIFYPYGTIVGSITRVTHGMREYPPEMNIPVMQDWAFWAIQVISILLFVFAIFIWKYKKWGVYSFLGLYILNFMIPVINGMPIIYSLSTLLVPIFLILFIRPVWSVFE